MKIRSIICLAAAALLCATSGCASMAKKEALFRLNKNPKAAPEEIRKVGSGLVNKILTSLKKKDYKNYISCFVDENKEKLSARKFDELATDFNKRISIKEIVYLGSVNKGPCQLLLWRAVLQHTPAIDAILKQQKKNLKEPLPEAVIVLGIGKVEKDWKALAFSIM